jgi:hypothetical protein
MTVHYSGLVQALQLKSGEFYGPNHPLSEMMQSFNKGNYEERAIVIANFTKIPIEQSVILLIIFIDIHN